MATTTFLGPVVSKNGFIGDVNADNITMTAPNVLAADIADKAATINTAGKVKGKLVYDEDGVIYIASGPADVDKWLASDGTPVTPA